MSVNIVLSHTTFLPIDPFFSCVKAQKIAEINHEQKIYLSTKRYFVNQRTYHKESMIDQHHKANNGRDFLLALSVKIGQLRIQIFCSIPHNF